MEDSCTELCVPKRYTATEFFNLIILRVPHYSVYMFVVFSLFLQFMTYISCYYVEIKCQLDTAASCKPDT